MTAASSLLFNSHFTIYSICCAKDRQFSSASFSIKLYTTSSSFTVL